MSRVLAWGQVWVSVKEKSRVALSDKHKIRIRVFTGLGTSFIMLFLSFFKVILPQVGWGQIIIIVALGAGIACLLLRKDQFWITTIVAASVFWPAWLVAPHWSGIQLWAAGWLYRFSKINPTASDGIQGSAQYALAAVFGCLLGIELARMASASEFVDRYKAARKLYCGELSPGRGDEIAERLVAEPLNVADLSLEVKLLLRQREAVCVTEISRLTTRAEQRLKSNRYKLRKANAEQQR